MQTALFDCPGRMLVLKAAVAREKPHKGTSKDVAGESETRSFMSLRKSSPVLHGSCMKHRANARFRLLRAFFSFFGAVLPLVSVEPRELAELALGLVSTFPILQSIGSLR